MRTNRLAKSKLHWRAWTWRTLPSRSREPTWRNSSRNLKKGSDRAKTYRQKTGQLQECTGSCSKATTERRVCAGPGTDGSGRSRATERAIRSGAASSRRGVCALRHLGAHTRVPARQSDNGDTGAFLRHGFERCPATGRCWRRHQEGRAPFQRFASYRCNFRADSLKFGGGRSTHGGCEWWTCDQAQNLHEVWWFVRLCKFPTVAASLQKNSVSNKFA